MTAVRWFFAALAVGLTSVGCGGGGSGGEPAAMASPCASLPAEVRAAALPPDVPAPAAAVFYERAVQGATQIYFGYLPGDDVRAMRAEVRDLLLAAGYSEQNADAEGNVEAELGFAGPHEGRVQVRHLCSGQLRLRYLLLD